MLRRRVQSLAIGLKVAIWVSTLATTLAAQSLQISRRSDFSTQDGSFTFADTLHARVFAANINYLDLDKNEFELQPASGGDSKEGKFVNQLNGSYEARIPLSDLDQKQSNWRFRVEIRDHRNGQFKAEVPILIQSGQGVGDTLLITGRLETVTKDYISLSGNNRIYVDNRTLVMEGTRTLSLSDLQPEWKVQVLAQRGNDNKLWARLILVLERSTSYPIETKGFVASIADSVVTINNIAFTVVPTTKLLDDKGNAITLAGFKVGMEVEAKGMRLANGVVIALRLKIEDENYSGHEIELTGQITALIDSVRRYVVVNDTPFEVIASTEILGFDNEPIAFADLHVGELVEVKGRTRAGNVPLASRIKREDGNGADFEVRGLISALGDSTVTVNRLLFRIVPTTIILDEKNNFIAFNALRTGMVVEVRAQVLASSTPMIATRIKIEKQAPPAIEIKGFIDQLTENSLTVLGLTFLVDRATVVLDENNQVVPFAALRTGMLVEIKAVLGTDLKLYAIRIKIEDFDRDEIELRGVITDLQNNEKFVEVTGIKFYLTAATVITDQQGNAITFEALAIGQVVEVHARREGGRWLASRIQVEDRIDPIVEIFGRIERIAHDGGDTLYLYGRPFVVTNTTVIVNRQNQPIPFEALQAGNFVKVRAQLIADHTFIALRVELRSQPGNDEFEFTGTLNALSFTAIQVDGIEFQVNAATVYLGPDDQPIKIDDLHLGMTVEIKARLQGGRLLAVQVKVEDRRALAGSLTQVSGNTIYVQDLPHVVTDNSLLLDAQNRPVTVNALRAGQQVELVAQASPSQLEVVTLRIVSSSPTGVKEGGSPAAPSSFALWQNYPNPFNPSTVIRFALPQAGQMRLAVYNILGHRIRMLMEGVRPAGEFQVTWDGRDEAGRQVASGIYIYRLEAQGQSQTRKLTLMR